MRTTRDAPPRDWQEGRRLRALALHEQGWKGMRIAEALGVTRGAVSPWLKAAREGGREALRQRPPHGHAPQVTEAHRARLPDLLARGAESSGCIGAVWTTARVATVIRHEFGVRHHPAHVSRILKTLRWTRQKPVPRSPKRDAAQIATGREQRRPALEATPRRRGGPSSPETNRASRRCRAGHAPPCPVARRRCCGRH